MPLPLNPRTIASIFRTATYGGIAGVFAVGNAEAADLVNAVVAGGVMADFSTWFLRSIALLPEDLFHGCYDGVVNLLFGWFIFHTSVYKTDYNGEALAMAMLTFMLVAGIKIAFYACRYLEHSMEDDE